jgi:anaerobic selenocysteine-containing dehydrogenase
VRDAGWHRKGAYGTLRMHPSDASALCCAEGEWVRLTSARGSAEAPVEITDELQPGHVSLPNGQGIDYRRADGTVERRGVAVNELTNVHDRDPFAETPWHKHVPVQIERLATQRIAA